MAKKPTTREEALVWDPENGGYISPLERYRLLDDDERPSSFQEYVIEPKPQDNSKADEEPSTTSRDVDRGGAKGTQTSPSPANFDAVAARIMQQNPGVRFNQDFNFQNENTGSQSNSLPTTPGSIPNPERTVTIAQGPNAGMSVYQDDPNLEAYTDGEMLFGTRETVIDANGETVVSKEAPVDYYTGKPIAQGAQRGDSPAADVGDQGKQVSGRLAEALNDKEGMRAYMKKIGADTGEGRDRRSEAFMNGSDDTLKALQAAKLSQGYISTGNGDYRRGKDGEMVKMSGDEVAALKANRNATASEEFLAQYLQKPATPADQQSSDSERPYPTTYATSEQIEQRVLQGSPFYETDATKIDGIEGWTEVPGDQREYLTRTLPARADVSEPSHNWFSTDFDVATGVDDREPLMRFE